MPTITVVTEIRAPIEKCFDLARYVQIHAQTAAFSKERVLERSAKSLLELGDTVTFEGTHFGIRQRMTARITEIDPPSRFVDQMVRGPFKSLTHVHEFSERASSTIMRDSITWESPLGILGKLADPFISRHLRSFLIRRNAAMKQLAEDLRGC